MKKKELMIENKLGLHARAAAKLVHLASRYSSEICLSREGCNQSIDSKSILGVLMLAASRGTRLVVSVEGPEEADEVFPEDHLESARAGPAVYRGLR